MLYFNDKLIKRKFSNFKKYILRLVIIFIFLKIVLVYLWDLLYEEEEGEIYID